VTETGRPATRQLKAARALFEHLAGVSFSLANGSARLYQIVATKHASRASSTMPPTREHLYAVPETQPYQEVA